MCVSNGTNHVTTTTDGANVVAITGTRNASVANTDKRFAILDYIADMTGELAQMASMSGSPVLARLLSIAEVEARRGIGP